MQSSCLCIKMSRSSACEAGLQLISAGASIPVQVRKTGGPGDSEGMVPAETGVIHMDQNDSWFRDTGPAVRPPSGRYSAAQHF